LGPLALAFAAASTQDDQRALDTVIANGRENFTAAWLRHRGLEWAAELVASFPSQQQETPP
jgi:type IV secretion system protein VirB4